MKKLRLALIGQGRSGRDIHGKHLHTDTDRFEVVAIVDALEERRARAAEEFGCEVLSDYRQLFGRTDIDLVVNCSYSHHHQPISLDLLNHGFNVLSEKPCARTAAEVQELIDAAARNNRMMAMFQQSRFAPYFEKIKDIIASGELGRIIQVSICFSGYQRRWDWQCCQCFNAGSLYNTGPHPVDQALNLLDYYDGMPDILCKMDRVNTFGDAEDYVKLIMTAPDRPLIDIEISSCDAYPTFTYKIHGSKGGLTCDTEKIDWTYYRDGDAPHQELIKTPLSNAQGLPMYCGEKLAWITQQWKVEEPGTFTYATRRLYDTVYDHLVYGKPLVVTLEQVKQQMAVMEECHRQNPLSVREELPEGVAKTM